MVALFWLLAVGAGGGLVWGVRTGLLDPAGMYYPAGLVGWGLFWGLAVGTAAGRAFAWLTRSVWGGLLVGLLLAAGLVYAVFWTADWLLPPIYYREGSWLWQTQAPGQVVAVVAAPATAIAYPLAFAFWRWWGR